MGSLFSEDPSLVAQSVNNLPARQETWVRSLGQENLLEKGMATQSSTLAWEIHGQRSLAAYSHGVAKSRTRPSDEHFLRGQQISSPCDLQDFFKTSNIPIHTSYTPPPHVHMYTAHSHIHMPPSTHTCAYMDTHTHTQPPPATPLCLPDSRQPPRAPWPTPCTSLESRVKRSPPRRKSRIR